MSDISKHLGKTVQYESKYDPSLLVKELRETNRTSQNITSSFAGYDVWNIYEVSFLLDNGYPVNGIGKLVYTSSNDVIVESKSLKLYFFSFNMHKLGSSIEESVEQFEQTVKKDLSELLGVQVEFSFIQKEHKPCNYGFWFDPIEIDYANVDFSVVNEDPSLLKVIDQPTSQHIVSDLMRSNCKITHQPDWADIYIYYKANKTLDLVSLQQYIVSFRNESHFHEECVETIYDRLFKILEPEELVVLGKYTRRGGLDINPIRATSIDLIDEYFIDSSIVNQKTLRQ